MFLTDLLFLLRLPNFWELLSQPVSTFIEELYGGGDQDLSREFQNSLNNSAYINTGPLDASGGATTPENVARGAAGTNVMTSAQDTSQA